MELLKLSWPHISSERTGQVVLLQGPSLLRTAASLCPDRGCGTCGQADVGPASVQERGGIGDHREKAHTRDTSFLSFPCLQRHSSALQTQHRDDSKLLRGTRGTNKNFIVFIEFETRNPPFFLLICKTLHNAQHCGSQIFTLLHCKHRS